MSVGDELHRHGDHRGAATLYRKALPQDRQLGSHTETVRSLVRCRFEWAREIGARPKLEEVKKAVDLIRLTLKEFGPELQGVHGLSGELVSTILWELTLQWARMGNVDEAIGAFRVLSGELTDSSPAEPLELAARTLAEAGESNRIAATRILAKLLPHHRTNEWIWRCGALTPTILVKLVASLGESEESWERDQLCILLGQCLPPLASPVEREPLASLGEDRTRPLATRQLALKCLVDAADLPIPTPKSEVPDAFPSYAPRPSSG